MTKEEIKVEKISSNEQFEECMNVTREAWKEIPEIEQIPTHIMKASSRTGQFLIALLDGKLVGYSMSFTQLPATLYLHAIGVREPYKGRGIGEAIMRKMKEEAAKSGFRFINFTYPPLLGINANLYIHKMGAKVDTYEEDAYCKTLNRSTGNALEDRFLASINLNAQEGQRHNLAGIDDVRGIRLNWIEYTAEGMQIVPLNPRVQCPYRAIEVPSSDFKESPEAKRALALQYRTLFQRSLKQQQIIDFLSFAGGKDRKNFYILKNR